jgi:outer membrane protein TolC
MSLSARQAVEIGLRESPMVHAAQSDIAAAAAETRAARSMTRPQLSANTYLTYGDSGNIFASSPGVAPQNYLSVAPHGFADQNLTLMAPLYTGGKLQGMVRSAHAREQAATADSDETRSDVALQIREAYYRALLGREIAKSAQARLDSDTASVATTRATVEAGKAIEATLQRMLAEEADARRALATATNDEAKALLDLKAAMGISLDATVSLTDTLEYRPVGTDLAAALKSADMARPELRAVRLRRDAASAQTGATRGSLQPQIYGAAMADGFGGQGMSGTGYSVGVTVSLPLIDAGQRRAEIAGARAAQDRADATLKVAELAVEKEVRTAWLDVETASANYRTAQAALEAAQAAYDVAVLRVQNGKAILLEQLDTSAALTQARTNVAAALFDHALALARLDRAMGRTVPLRL